jgi:SOS-response transcriptional repressor LexA/DNA-binding XRE family transcriptional regulator
MARKQRKSVLARPKPPWAVKISALRAKLALNQADLGERLRTSAMAVSRWERGVQEPASRSYIELGNLSGDPDCWYFWGRAGLRNEHILRVVPMLRKRLRIVQLPNMEIATAGSGRRLPPEAKLQLVAIPLLKLTAASHGEQGADIALLQGAAVESMIAAPREWCPNPADTSCLRVQGKSMMPLINDGYIVAVDASQNNRKELNGKVVIAWHRDKGLTVSRLRRFDSTEILQPENAEHESITLSRDDGWSIIAKVLWWIGKAP